MAPFVVLEGVAAPLDRSKVDTDQILPARFLRRPRKQGYGQFLFKDWADDPAFVLNQAPYRHAKILVADRAFGGGSSREQAPWALSDYGIRCVIAVDFGNTVTNLDNGADLVNPHARIEVRDLSSNDFVNFVSFNCFHIFVRGSWLVVRGNEQLDELRSNKFFLEIF